MNKRGEWQQLYEIAVLETNWSRMEDRVRVVESAIEQRLRELSLNHGDTPEEIQAMMDAVCKLNVLRADAALWRQKNRK